MQNSAIFKTALILLLAQAANRCYVPPGQPATSPAVSRQPAGPHTLTRPELHRLAERCAARYELNPNLVKAIITVESDWDPSAVSSAGCLGLMQLKPSTAADFVPGISAEELLNPGTNIEIGCRYLVWIHQRVHRHFQGIPETECWRLVCASYFAGPERVRVHRGVPAIADFYVARVERAVRRLTDSAGQTR